MEPLTASPVRRQIQSLERAAAILRLLSGRKRRLGVVDLARELGLPKGTVHGILRTLQDKGLVEQNRDSGKYQLGAALLPLGFAYLESNRLRLASLNAAHGLAIRSGRGVRVGALHDEHVLIVHQVIPPDDSRRALDIGSLAPTHATALGKALLSDRRDLRAQLDAQGLQRFTPATVTDVARLLTELDEIACRGWASEIGELSSGIASIAAPIATGSDAKPGAIGIEGSIERLCDGGTLRAELVSAVIESSRAVSRELGTPPWSRDAGWDEAPGRPI